MAYRDLREFIKVLENKGLLHRVKVEVDPVLEIAEITDRMCKSPNGGKALFFLKMSEAHQSLLLPTFLALLKECALPLKLKALMI